MKSHNQFPWDQKRFGKKMENAVKSYWEKRQKQADKQATKGKKDAGTRGEVTGGQHLDGIAAVFIELAKVAGYSDKEIIFAKPPVLPGYYRAQKKWDIAIVRNNRLVAAIEMKSQSGSFGNNLNNRSEEVLGLARDFWTAYREKAFGLSPQPWLGYLFLLEESPKSTRPVGLAPSTFPPFPIFNNTSYLDRYGILCERLMLERDYSATALLLSPKSPTGKFSEPRADLTSFKFAQSLFAHLVAHR